MIKKAVIPCGGRGTRFLPVTKAVPKEILPVIDTPVLHYIVEEIIKSGIYDVQIVLSPGKEGIKRYFQPDAELEEALLAAGKKEEAAGLKKISQSANVSFVYQEKPRGSADAIAKTRAFVGSEPFALCLGDDMIASGEPVVGQLCRAYEDTGRAIIGVQQILTDDITKYGVIEAGAVDGRLIECRRIVEKPPISQLPSRYACLGRYVITPDFFDTLEQIRPGANGELALPDSLNIMCKQGVYAYDFEGKRYDMGNKLEAAKATVDFALSNPEFGNEFRDYLVRIIK